MKQAAENQLRKTVSILAAVIALLVILALPSAYLYVQSNHLSNNLQFKADIIADDVSVYVFQYPENWHYQEDRLVGFLEKKIQLQKEKVILQGRQQDAQIKISSGVHERPPLMQRHSLVNDGLNDVAVITIQSSLYPLIVNTFYVLFASLILGILIFVSLFFWPLKALRLTISKLDDVRLELEKEVSENRMLLNQSGDLTQKLISQRDFTDTVLEVAGNIIVVLDMNGCFVRFNRAAEELTGFNSDEVLGSPVWDFVIPEDQKEAVQQVFDNLRKGNTKIAGQYENDWLSRDGGRRTLDWHNSVLHNRAGEITHIVTLGYDVTERNAAEEHRQRLQRELNQARKMEALGQLTGGIAHDFNNILGIITGYSDLALEELEDSGKPEIKEYVKNILLSSKRASDLVKQMMVFSRGGQGRSEPHELQRVINENIKMLRSVLPSSIQMNFSFDEDLPQVMVDTVQIQQIMMNLCLNAKDAMEGEGKLDIKLTLHSDINAECRACHQQVTGDWLELSVSDTGEGMTDDVLERIFEPFYTTKAVGEGTGMGLSMVHTIVDNHSGHILITTQIDQGTTFKLLFPPLSDQGVKVLEEVDLEVSHDKYLGHKEKILIVDDELALASYIEGMLTKKGYQCETRTQSPEALALFKSDPDGYDLLLTDQTMPELTGVELIKEVRKLRPDIPVILATGYSDVISREQAEEQGIVFVNKPFTSSHLLKCISDSLKNNEA